MIEISERLQQIFRRNEYSRAVHIFHLHPNHYTTSAGVIDAERRAARDIAELQQIIDDLTEYRAALATRYNELATMPYTPHLELTRHRSSYSGITYTVRVFNSNEDGTEAEILRETYPGKERHTAIARYKELLKQRPGIVAEMHIEKSRWER